MGKNSGNGNGVCRSLGAISFKAVFLCVSVSLARENLKELRDLFLKKHPAQIKCEYNATQVSISKQTSKKVWPHCA